MKLEYIVNDDKTGLVVTGGKDLEGELIIPSEDSFEGKIYPVTAIGYWAFCECKALTSIVIPDSVTKIGYWAFSGCRALTSIVIPDSVTEIGDGAFGECNGLTSIIVDKENEHYDSL